MESANTVYIDLFSFSANNMGYNELLGPVRFPTSRESELKRLSNAAELWSFLASRLPQLLLFVAMLPEKLRFGAIYAMKRGFLLGDFKTRWASRNSCQTPPSFFKHWNLVEILSFCHNKHRQQIADALASAFCKHSLSVTKPPSWGQGTLTQSQTKTKRDGFLEIFWSCL